MIERPSVATGRGAGRDVRISLAVISMNEERNIARCIESCAGAVEEIVLVDSGSADRTVEIARALGAVVRTHPFDDYGSQKNRAVDMATGDWVLNLDADEWASDELRRSLRAIAAGAAPDCAAVGFPRHNRICGRWPRFGGWRERAKYRLWRRGHVRWAGTVHEWAELDEGYTQARAQPPIMHDLGNDWSSYSAKQLRYAALQADQMHANGRRAGAADPLVHGAAAGMRCGLLQLGLLEGRLGLRTAMLRARAAHRKWSGLRSIGRGVDRPGTS